MLYQEQYIKIAHEEVNVIFYAVFPSKGLKVREEQIRLCHEMLDTLSRGQISLCDAGVGIGKTYAYLVACILMRKYLFETGIMASRRMKTVVISTSSIALQEALMQEYIPFLSRTLLQNGLIETPIKAVVRKGKEHFVCDERLEKRLLAIEDKKKNEIQKNALLKLKTGYDMDVISSLSGYDRRQVCVPKFCPRECQYREGCRYQLYLKQAKSPDIDFQICNHNYLLADALHRENGYRPLLSDYHALVVDEAHKLTEAAKAMATKTLSYEDIQEVCSYLEREDPGMHIKRMKAILHNMFCIVGKNHRTDYGYMPSFRMTEECEIVLEEGISAIRDMIKRIKGSSMRWVQNRLEEMEELLISISGQNHHYVYHLSQDKNHLPVLCATSRQIPDMLEEILWNKGFPAILTSGTLKAGESFGRTRQMLGLFDKRRIREFVADSPFEYKKNCMLYLPNLEKVRHGSREEAAMIAAKIRELSYSTYGHTLVLFTSYSLMGNVYQLLRDRMPFPLVEVWRHAKDEIMRFKNLDNAILFAAGPCWEGVDFPGDMVSSLIIVRLPFAAPDPIGETQKEEYDTLSEYIESIIVPDMQMKLRQGFGRAIRTEEDTCVVSILDQRAVSGGRYNKEVLCALPACQMTDDIKQVEEFIRRQKKVDYYM